MINNIILASKSGVRKKILDQNGIICEVIPANVDEDLVKESLLKEKETPKTISKNLAELKANKISTKKTNRIVFKTSGNGWGNTGISQTSREKSSFKSYKC